MNTATPPGRIVLEGVGISFGRNGNHVEAVRRISFAIGSGEFVCLLGPSGCGKSTLLNAIAGFIHPTEGSLTVDGEPVLRPAADRGMVFQHHSLFPWKTVLANVEFTSPTTSTRSGRRSSSTGSIAAMIRPVCAPWLPEPTPR